MNKFRSGKCSNCPSVDRIVKSLPSVGKLCYDCNKERLGVRVPKPISKKRKATGEGVLFESIWNSRAHVSFVSGKRLGDEMNACFFAHVLPKSIYPKFRLYDRNIVLLTMEEHHKYDFTSIDLDKDPQFAPLFELRDKLRQEYLNIPFEQVVCQSTE